MTSDGKFMMISVIVAGIVFLTLIIGAILEGQRKHELKLECLKTTKTIDCNPKEVQPSNK